MVTTAPLGIIDTLSAGFATVNKRLWLLLLPVLLDLLLVYGPSLTFTPVVDASLDLFQGTIEGRSGPPSPEGMGQALQQSKEALTALRGTNLVGILAWQVPSIISATSSTPLPKVLGQVAVEAASGWEALAYGLSLALLSLLGASLYFTAIAQSLQSEVFALTRFLLRTLRGWLSFSFLFVGLLLLALPGSGFLLLLFGAASLLGTGLFGLVTSIVTAAGITAAFYLYFVDDAIFYQGAWPLRAAWYSTYVIWRNIWPALGFILLANLIQTGLPLAWKLVLENPLGLFSAILGHAYVSTGLATAGMLFFSQRFLFWQQASAKERGLTNS